MTVDEALEIFWKEAIGSCPGSLMEAHETLRRYVERVRQIEKELATPMPPCRQAVRLRLAAAAREGRDD